jgi:hypothetical protein
LLPVPVPCTTALLLLQQKALAPSRAALLLPRLQAPQSAHAECAARPLAGSRATPPLSTAACLPGRRSCTLSSTIRGYAQCATPQCPQHSAPCSQQQTAPARPPPQRQRSVRRSDGGSPTKPPWQRCAPQCWRQQATLALLPVHCLL